VLVAFDVFGTLADTTSVVDELAPICGPEAGTVTARWRARQLEYMFRVTAMGQFPPFEDLTRWGLVAALRQAGIAVPGGPELYRLVGAYRRLAPYADVVPALRGLHELGHELVAFSVAPRAWVAELTRMYKALIDRVVSAEDAGAYKPHPGIYEHLLRTVDRAPPEVLLVSSNPFDIIGGAAVGLKTVWCRRDPSAIFDPWGAAPDHVVSSLVDVCELDLRTWPPGASQPGPKRGMGK
jgi:2-haloacid dehalogenase